MSSSLYDIRFTGRVQGVNFRWTTCQVARRFAIAGWVRNEPDGSVRCLAQGDQDELDSFVKAVQDAMAGYISDTKIVTGTASDELHGFTVRS